MDMREYSVALFVSLLCPPPNRSQAGCGGRGGRGACAHEGGALRDAPPSFGSGLSVAPTSIPTATNQACSAYTLLMGQLPEKLTPLVKALLPSVRTESIPALQQVRFHCVFVSACVCVCVCVCLPAL
jgi:hypothetical protein